MGKRHKDGNFDQSGRRPQLNLKKETRIGVAVVVFFLLAIIFTLSLVGSAGPFGQVANQVMKLAFGWIAYGVPLMFIMVALALMKQRKEDEHHAVSTHAYVGAIFLTLALTGFMHMLTIKSADPASAFTIAKLGQGGGYLGVLTSFPLVKVMGFAASLIVLIAGIIVSLLVTFNVSLFEMFRRDPDEVKESKQAALKINSNGAPGFMKEPVSDFNRKAERFVVNHPADTQVKAEPLKPNFTSEDKNWKFPSLDMLEESKTKVDSGNIEANVSIIKRTLADFGIDVEMGEVNVGPTVTQYTFRPSVGVKLSQIAALQNDLALALAASPVRMELPIPGKALVGIEVPNKSTALVRIKEILGSAEFLNNPSKLAFALGRDVAGHPMVADLAKMPHLLVAGATGSGKSVCINSLLVSFLFRSTPNEVKFIVIDPKRVELSLYNGMPHLLTPVVTDHQQAVNALKWAVGEMDSRYKKLSEVHKRNISEYNASVLVRLPYIVIIIDELADLMAVAQKDVEAAIVRLAQMARAVGIHLVVATQRPSVDVITGLIKANITTRVAFTVASQVDSRTILDNSGAEKLLGSGDMLYITAELTKPKRVQGAFVVEKEIKKVTDFLRDQAGSVIYNHEIVEKQRGSGGPGAYGGGGDDYDDELVEEAINVVSSTRKASTTYLQRRLRIGYARAARLMDILEEKGVVGPGEGAKPREVYASSADRSPNLNDEFDEAKEYEEDTYG
ncbi:MAG: DNA translocase FtsK 4TM domain-containing protein [Acidobacteriaceae bacterium]